MPKVKYSIIYADPPWQYADSGCSGSVTEFDCMSDADLLRLPVDALATKNCCLFLWATYPHLGKALKIIEMWGFTYKSIAFQWIKTNRKSGGYFYGLGRWTRGNTEPCLFAVRGKPKRVSASVHQIIEYPMTRHSAKPSIARDKIVELVGDLRRIELFARDKAEGWDSTGLEVDGMDIRDFLLPYLKKSPLKSRGR